MEPHRRAPRGPPAGNTPATARRGARTPTRPTDHRWHRAGPGRGENSGPRTGGNRLMAHPPLADHRDRAGQAAHGTGRPWADPDPVRDHVTRLLETGTFRAVGQAAQVGEMTVWEIAHRARPAIKQDTAAA